MNDTETLEPKIIERGTEKEYLCEGFDKTFHNYGTTDNHEKWECSEYKLLDLTAGGENLEHLEL